MAWSTHCVACNAESIRSATASANILEPVLIIFPFAILFTLRRHKKGSNRMGSGDKGGESVGKDKEVSK